MDNVVVFDDGELELKVSIKEETVWLNRNQLSELFDREVTRDIEHYNLDVIISVGYRVKSQKGVRFRQWAASVLKSYIQNGFAINEHKITQQRLSSLESDVADIKSHIESNSLDLKQGIFFDGQIFDAYVFVSDLIKNAKKSIVLIDNYIDEKVLTYFSKNQNS